MANYDGVQRLEQLLAESGNDSHSFVEMIKLVDQLTVDELFDVWEEMQHRLFTLAKALPEPDWYVADIQLLQLASMILGQRGALDDKLAEYAKRFTPPGRELSPERQKQIVDMYRSGKRVTDIVRDLGVSPPSVYKYLKEHGEK